MAIVSSLLISIARKQASKKAGQLVGKTAARSKTFRTTQEAFRKVTKHKDLGRIIDTTFKNFAPEQIQDVVNDIQRIKGDFETKVSKEFIERYHLDTSRQIQKKLNGLKPKKLITGEIDEYFKEREKELSKQNEEQIYDELRSRLVYTKGPDHSVTCINSVSFKPYRNALKKISQFMKLDDVYLFAENPDEVDNALRDVDIPGSLIFIFNTAQFKNGNTYRHPEIAYDGRGNFVESPNRLYNQDLVKDFSSKPNSGWCRRYIKKYMIGKPGAKTKDKKLYKG